MQTIAVLVFSGIVALVSIVLVIRAGKPTPKPLPIRKEQDWRTIPAFGGHQIER